MKGWMACVIPSFRTRTPGKDEEMEQMTGRSERHGGRRRCAIGLGTVVQYGDGIKLWKGRGESKARIAGRSELEGSHSAMAEGGFAPYVEVFR